jgi:hypothetical protein
MHKTISQYKPNIDCSTGVAVTRQFHGLGGVWRQFDILCQFRGIASTGCEVVAMVFLIIENMGNHG